MTNSIHFISGLPRSGSTLLARMIGSHSQIYGRGEPHMLTPLAHLGYYDYLDTIAILGALEQVLALRSAGLQVGGVNAQGANGQGEAGGLLSLGQGHA